MIPWALRYGTSLGLLYRGEMAMAPLSSPTTPTSVIFGNSVKSDLKLEFNSIIQILSKRPSLQLLDSLLYISSKQQSHSSKLKWAKFIPAENQLFS